MTLGLDDLGTIGLGDSGNNDETIISPRMHVTAAVDGSMIGVNAWVTNLDGSPVLNAFNLVVEVYGYNGTLMAGPFTVETPDINGVFALGFAPPSMAPGARPAYFKLSADVGTEGDIPVHQVAGATFYAS